MNQKLRILLALVPVAAALLAGCNGGDDMSGTVKPNPNAKDRFKKPDNLSTSAPVPKGVAAAPKEKSGDGTGAQ